MMSITEETHEENYITPQEFEQFILSLREIGENNYKATPQDLEMCARIQYGCGLRISEVLTLTPQDIDLENMILTLNHAKTGFKKCKCAKYEKKRLVSCNPSCFKCKGKGKIRKPQFTTILPSQAQILRDYLPTKKKTRQIFTFGRTTIWGLYKQAGIKANLRVREQQDEKIIDGVWTHLLRKCRAKLMRKLDAKEELIALKLRHSFNTTQRYTKPDLQYLKLWESQQGL